MRTPQTRIGDIFEIPITPLTKRYMQFILVDSSCLGGWCIRVFKREYHADDKPTMEEVISGEVDFYCLTYAIGKGVVNELWSKAGNSKEVGSFDNIIFKQKDIVHGGWRIWRARQEVKRYRTLPKRYAKASMGALLAPSSVVKRIQTGRWRDIPNVYDDYKGAAFIERLIGAEFIPKGLKVI